MDYSDKTDISKWKKLHEICSWPIQELIKVVFKRLRVHRGQEEEEKRKEESQSDCWNHNPLKSWKGSRANYKAINFQPLEYNSDKKS